MKNRDNRYPDDWEEIAIEIKEKANWTCSFQLTVNSYQLSVKEGISYQLLIVPIILLSV